MPYCEFYGLAGGHLAVAVERVQRICTDGDAAGWRSFVEQLELIRHVPRIGSRFDPAPFQVAREPLANVDRHINPPALAPDRPPDLYYRVYRT